MPLPQPNKGEEEKDWISRCMSNPTMKSEYDDNDQRLAVCYSIWRDKDKKSVRTNRCFETSEIRAVASDGEPLPRLRGYAAIFDVETDRVFGYREKVANGAFAESLRRGDDVIANVEHKGGLATLGRTKAGTLTLREDAKGLFVDIQPPDTSAGREVVTLIERGDLSHMSFAFDVADDHWETKDKVRIRTLKRLDLFDVSIVNFPAYLNTHIDSTRRSLDEGWASWQDRLATVSHLAACEKRRREVLDREVDAR